MENDSNIIDTYAVSEVCDKFGVKDSEVHGALLSGDPHDQLAIAYHLIIDNKRFADEAARAEIKDFYVAASPPPMKFSPSDKAEPFRPHPERIAPLRERGTTTTGQPIAGGGPAQLAPAGGGTPAVGSAAGLSAADAQLAANEQKNVARGNPVKRAKWHLGIRSQSKPNDIMLEVYRAMKALDYEWKIINAYHVRVRRVNRMDTTSDDMKMSLQLYQVDAKSYLLDFKSLTNEEVEQGDDVIMESLTPPNPMGPSHMPQQPTGHHTMEFFEMCAALIIQLAR